MSIARPVDTFVASFLGSPPANLLPARFNGAALAVGERSLPVPRNGAPDDVIFAIRPEDIRIEARDAARARRGARGGAAGGGDHRAAAACRRRERRARSRPPHYRRQGRRAGADSVRPGRRAPLRSRDDPTNCSSKLKAVVMANPARTDRSPQFRATSCRAGPAAPRSADRLDRRCQRPAWRARLPDPAHYALHALLRRRADRPYAAARQSRALCGDSVSRNRATSWSSPPKPTRRQAWSATSWSAWQRTRGWRRSSPTAWCATSTGSTRSASRFSRADCHPIRRTRTDPDRSACRYRSAA